MANDGTPRQLIARQDVHNGTAAAIRDSMPHAYLPCACQEPGDPCPTYTPDSSGICGYCRNGHRAEAPF
jgi:hypothetical protein